MNLYQRRKKKRKEKKQQEESLAVNKVIEKLQPIKAEKQGVRKAVLKIY